MDRERRGAPPDDIAVARPHAGRARCPHRSAATPRPRRPLPHIPCSLFQVTVSLPTTARWYWAVYVYVSLHLHASSFSPHTTFSSRAISSSVNSEKNARRRCASGGTRRGASLPAKRRTGRGEGRADATSASLPAGGRTGRGAGGRGGARPSRRGGGRL